MAILRQFCLLAASLSVIMAGSAPAGTADKTLDIYWIDVEGGAATLLVTPKGQSILVDSGNAGERDPARILAVATRVARLERIDTHIVTHWHGDHFGGTPALAERIPFRAFIDHGPSVEPGNFEEKFAWYFKLARGNRTVWKPGATLDLAGDAGGPPVRLLCVCAHGKVLPLKDGSQPAQDGCAKHPAKPDDKTDNAQSIGFKLSFGDFDFLDLGDLTWNIEHRLVCPENNLGEIDVFQTSHHGLGVSNNPALVHTVAPRVVVMNNGPRKGGELPVVQTVRSSPGLQALFQVHRNVRTSEPDNAPPEFIANQAEKCAGDYVWLKVARDGKSYTLAAGAAGKPHTFQCN
jgi:beta-lactamase superfamily II metal-dependent hydrolase